LALVVKIVHVLAVNRRNPNWSMATRNVPEKSRHSWIFPDWDTGWTELLPAFASVTVEFPKTDDPDPPGACPALSRDIP